MKFSGLRVSVLVHFATLGMALERGKQTHLPTGPGAWSLGLQGTAAEGVRASEGEGG